MTLLRDINATLDAETTKVIGTVNIADGQEIGIVGTVPLPSGAATEATLAALSAKIADNGEIADNSTTTPLNAAATFTGTAVDVSGFPSVVVACKTDQEGVLYAEFSPDGTNWDSSLPFVVLAESNEIHRLTVTRKYFRARFTNTSASNQTYLRLQSLAGSQTNLNSPLNGVVQRDADALVTRPIDFNSLVAKGLYEGHTANIKDAFKTDIDSGSNLTDDLSSELAAGDAYTGFPISPVAAEVVVAAADTGTVFYSYMATNTDTDYTFGSVAVTGAGTYALGHNIWRCNFAYFVKNSDTALNAGNITVQSVAGPGTNVFCQIPTGHGQSFCGAFTVPFNSSVLIDRISGTMKGSATGVLEGFFWVRPFGESPRYRFPFELHFGVLFFDDIDYLIRLPARTDFIPRVTFSSANNQSCRFTYRLIRIKD
jgi:hypothetical protein